MFAVYQTEVFILFVCVWAIRAIVIKSRRIAINSLIGDDTSLLFFALLVIHLNIGTCNCDVQKLETQRDADKKKGELESKPARECSRSEKNCLIQSKSKEKQRRRWLYQRLFALALISLAKWKQKTIALMRFSRGSIMKFFGWSRSF